MATSGKQKQKLAKRLAKKRKNAVRRRQLRILDRLTQYSQEIGEY